MNFDERAMDKIKQSERDEEKKREQDMKLKNLESTWRIT